VTILAHLCDNQHPVYPKWRGTIAQGEGKTKLFKLLDTRKDNCLDIFEIKTHVEKLCKSSEGGWSFIDADRIGEMLQVGSDTTSLNLTKSAFMEQLPVFYPVDTIPRLREHLLFMYGKLEDAFETFDIVHYPNLRKCIKLLLVVISVKWLDSGGEFMNPQKTSCPTPKSLGFTPAPTNSTPSTNSKRGYSC